MCVSICFSILLAFASLFLPEVVFSQGCGENSELICPSLVAEHIEDYQKLVSIDLLEREGWKTVNPKNFNDDQNEVFDTFDDVDSNESMFTDSSIDIFPQVETTPPNTNGHFGVLNSSCYFTDIRRVFFICDSLSVTSFPLDVPSVPVFKLNGTSVRSIPSHAFQDKEIGVISIVDNLHLKAFHHKPFMGVKGLRYLYIRRNIHWSGKHRPSNHSTYSSQNFFELFEGADTLLHLVLDFNNITFQEDSLNAGDSKAVLPCLEYLSLANNKIIRLEDHIFQPFRCSQIKELNLQNCHLKYIGKDTFSPLKHLQHVDFYQNPYLFQIQPGTFTPPILAAMSGLSQHNFSNLGFSSNGLNRIPTESLAFVKDSLTRLNLETNSFQQLGEGSLTFPKMPKLEILILDSCLIQEIASSTFENLTTLKVLSLRENPIHQFHTALLIPTLQTLDLQIKMESDSSRDFKFPSAMFEDANMSSLRSLTIEGAQFTNLSGYHFSGLKNLEILSLQRSTFKEIPNLILGNLSNLKNLSLAYCQSDIPIKLSSLVGPRELRVLDLSNAKIIVEFDHNHNGKSINTTFQPFPLTYTQVLNLTGSLKELSHPLDYLHFDRMKKLTVLEIGKNEIKFWNKTYFNSSFNIHTLRMRKNGRSISITEQMIKDFSNLSLLDLSHNEFICNSQIPAFYKMIQKRNGSLTVVGYGEGEREGEEYECKDEDHYCQTDQGENSPPGYMSFKEYATCGRDINQGTDIRDFVPATAIIGAVVGFSICLVVVSYLYVNRLYVSYYLLQFKSHYKAGTRRKEPFLYDAFISASQEDEDWVTGHLLPNLEMRDPKLRACVQNRDFEVGKTLTENIVECIDNSRKIVLIVSESYARSHWCMFEAHLAQHRLVEENRQSLIVVTKDKISPKLLTKKIKIILKSPSNLIWSSEDKDSSYFWKKLKVSLTKKSDIYAIETVSETI